MFSMGEFGERIRQAREVKGWSQEQLAMKLPQKYHGSYITKIEKHGVIPSNDLVIALIDRLGLPKSEMLILAYKERHPEEYKAIQEDELKSVVAEPITPYGLNEDDIEIARMAHPLTDEEKAELKEWIAFKKTRKAKVA